MTNNGAISKTITPSANTQSYTIPKGYHNGSGKITVFPFSGEIKVSQFQIHWTNTSFVNVAAKVGYYYYVLVPWNGSDNNPLRLNNDGAKLITSGYG